jgi:hypothetical protein
MVVNLRPSILTIALLCLFGMSWLRPPTNFGGRTTCGHEADCTADRIKTCISFYSDDGSRLAA